MKVRRKLFAKKILPASTSQMQKQPLGNTSSSLNLYQDCNKLTLDKFLDCLFDNDLSGLIIHGTATEEQLLEAWDKVYTHSCQLSGGNYNEVFQINNGMLVLKAKIALVNGIVSHLQMCYNEGLVAILNNIGLPCKLTITDSEDTTRKVLNSVVARAKKWVILLKKLQQDMDKIRSKETSKIERSHFDDQLDALGMHQGFMIEASKITVARFYRGINKMNEDYQRQQLKKSNVSNRKGR